MKKALKHILAILTPACLLFLVWYKMGFYYSTNDDRCLTEMLAGIMTLQPDAHLVYVNYLLALPLSLFYKITTSVAWFGWCLIAFYYLSFVFLLESAYSRCKNLFEELGITIVIACYFLAHLYLVGQMTYTAIAACIAVAGYCALLLHQNKKIGGVFFLILEAFSFLLRAQAMLMIQPLGLAVICVYFLISDFSMWKKNLVKCLKLIGVVLSIVIIGFLGNKLGYLGEEWSTYKSFNEARTVLCDYTDFPPYEDVKPILEKYEVSKATYEGYASYTILDYDICVDCLIELADYAKTHNDTTQSFRQIVEEYCNILTIEKDYYQMNKILLITFICTLLYILISGQYKMLLPLLSLVLSQGVVWFYLIYKGRYPDRVTIPLMASETLLLIAITFITYRNTQKVKKWVKLLRLATLLVIMVVFFHHSYTSGQLQYRDTKRINEGQKAFIQGLVETTEYCNQHPENKYIVETASLRWYSGSVFQTDIFASRNYIMAGGWFSNMPCILEKNRTYLNDTSNGFYFIIYSDGEEMSHSSVKYLAEKSGSTPTLADSFTVSHGGVYSVIYFDGELNIH